MTPQELSVWFEYHAPSLPQQISCAKVRAAGLGFAQLVLALTKDSYEQTTAIRKIREAVLIANQAIVLPPPPLAVSEPAPSLAAIAALGAVVESDPDPEMPCALLDENPYPARDQQGAPTGREPEPTLFPELP